MKRLIANHRLVLALLFFWQTAVPGGTLTADDLVMTNGDLLRGRIEKITGLYALVSTAYGVYRLPRLKIRRMHFPAAVPILVRQTDGSLIEGLLLEIDEEAIAIRQGNALVRIPWTGIRESFFAGPED